MYKVLFLLVIHIISLTEKDTFKSEFSPDQVPWDLTPSGNAWRILGQPEVVQDVSPHLGEVGNHCALCHEMGKGAPGSEMGLAREVPVAQHLRRYQSGVNSLSLSSVHLGPVSDCYICRRVIQFLPHFSVFRVNTCIDVSYSRVVNLKDFDILIFIAEPW